MKANVAAFALAGLALTATAQDAPNPDAETLATQGLVSQRQADQPVSTITRKPERGAGDKVARKAASVAPSQALNLDYWVFDAFAVIHDDLDFDGFHTRIELTFDVDTVFEQADVYAVLYLSLEGGPWTEYGVTDTFRIFGASGADDYFFDADLVSGFPTGYYDVLIEIYDTFDGRLVADFGPEDTAALFDLPLESISLDASNEPAVIVSSQGGGGSAGIISLGGLLAALALRRRSVGKPNVERGSSSLVKKRY
ncbi:MAG: choice-of-anchor H family protein [Pseudomonadota bacterium]